MLVPDLDPEASLCEQRWKAGVGRPEEGASGLPVRAGVEETALLRPIGVEWSPCANRGRGSEVGAAMYCPAVSLCEQGSKDCI